VHINVFLEGKGTKEFIGKGYYELGEKSRDVQPC
jgi:hypothetical protein